ncbi:glycoside hydrolase family 30 protein [Deminuibacter soli]|uniref:Glycosyl hydrolase n=1 Tax=Deminuibacter soli TaxID=2291815 RepID=A0A3E1NEF7_9BACT|nr:glycoside hydrolase family 30 protein [Deminuibacter soli]RFM26360.1 glycosyl hydrolase [Deminuibacter soli]
MKHTKYYSIALLSLLVLGVKAQTWQPISAAALQQKKVVVYVTADSSDKKLAITDTLHFTDFGQPLETQPCVFIDATHRFQTMVGMGAALTDASAETFYKLPANKQQELMKAFFDKKNGLGYTLARTHIASCDFSSDTYSYVQENDTALKTFNIDHDRKYRIPFIKAAIAAAGGSLTTFATPWSPYAWMKDNHDVLHGGKLLPQYRQAWANHYIRFIKAYEKEGIPIWGLSVQNEPMAKQTWESCVFTAEDEVDFVKNYLGPTLHKQGMAGKKLMVWDHNRDLLYQRAAAILNDPQAAKYVWGVAFHWYEDWTGGGKIFENVKRVHEAFPNTNLMFTEGCNEKFEFKKISEWKYGETYGRSILNDFNNGTVGWTDWNILLDEKGGPNHAGNFCLAPVHANVQTGEVYYTSAFYYIGHFSRFIHPGAQRISSASSRGQLQTTAFINKDGSVAVVVLNETKDRLPFRLWIQGKAAETVSLPHSIMTLVF